LERFFAARHNHAQGQLNSANLALQFKAPLQHHLNRFRERHSLFFRKAQAIDRFEMFDRVK
jgi:hypothetical protein